MSFIKKNWKMVLILSLFPIIFIGILECFSEKVTVDGWLGFLGGYFGVLGAVGAIGYQKSLDNEAAIKSIELYTDYIIENLSNKLEKNYMSFLSVFATLNGYDDFYEIEEIAKRKKDFSLINTDIINSNLSTILSNKKFIILLNLKEKLDNLNYYIIKLEEDNTQGNIYIPLMDNLDEILKSNKNKSSISESIFELIKELNFLKNILSKLNMSYYNKTLNFEDEEILSKYEFLIQNVRKAFDNKNNFEILEFYRLCITNIIRVIILINKKFQIKEFYPYYYYLYNVLSLIIVMKEIYEEIEKLKSTKK